jgi:SAM-dependent methyltransferase
MQDEPNAQGADAKLAAAGIDTNVPQSARVYDFLLGGKNNYAADRAVGAALIDQVPSLPVMIKANRAFLARAVRYLVSESGIRQFLDIGTGIPTANNVHEVAQQIVPETRVLYVDNDPIVLAHARALMSGSPDGKTSFILADLREPEAILASPALAKTLDLEEPVALMLVGILHHMHDDDEPHKIVETLLNALPSGSYLSISHPSADFDPSGMAAVAATAEQSGIPYVPRSRAELERFFAGLELVDPGVAPILGWRPDAETSRDVNSVFGYAAVGRKP